jgi:hypothetical protein
MVGTVRKIDPEEMRRLLEQNLPYREIAMRLGCTVPTVAGYRIKLGLPPRERRSYPYDALLNRRRKALLREVLGIASSLKEIKRNIRYMRRTMKKQHLLYPKMVQMTRYWEEVARRVSVLVLYFPQLAKEMGIAVDGMPEYLEKEIRSLYGEEGGTGTEGGK